MATVTKPMALDESFNTTENTSRNVADVLAEGLDSIAESILPKAATEIPIQSGSATNTKDYIDGTTKTKVMKFSETKTSSYGVVTTNIPITKCLLGYYFGSYGLIPYKHSSGNWYFNVVNAENGYIVPKVGETDTLTVYYFSFDISNSV